jgi:DNA-binding transcriptional MerR regulator
MESTLAGFRHREFSLDELVRTASRLVTSASVTQPDARVADLPDARGVRYYQTLGVVDKPLRYEGRQAVYGYRHLLQIVAVKRLQAQGHSLSQIQQALLGMTNGRIEEAVLAAAEPSAPRGSEHPVESTPEWRAEQVAPGVVVLLNAGEVAHPRQVLSQIKRSLSGLQGDDR